VAADEFEASHPGTSVVIEGISGAEYFDQLPQLLASSDAPDITALQVIPGVYTDLIDDDLLADVSSVWDDLNLENVYRPSTAARYTTSEGNQYAVSTALQWMPILYFNKQLLSSNGIELPTGHRITAEEWHDIAGRLAQTDYIQLATYGISDEYGAAFILGSMLYSSCGPEGYSNVLQNWQANVELKTTWTSTCALNALDELLAWGDSGVFGDAPAAQSSEGALRLFESGMAAFYESGGWATKYFADGHLGFDYDWCLLPSMSTGSPSAMMLGDQDGLGISANSAHQDLAREFLALVSSKEFQSQSQYLMSAGIPPRADVELRDSEDTMRIDQFDSISTLGDTTQLTVSVPYHSEIAQLTRELLAHEVTPQEVGQALDQEVQESRRSG
jgi:ABC-type glycerol-3-phosphate transport system substrate-binding protein